MTPEDAAAMTAGEPYVLDDTHAHAWVEYYQDGVGWLPFETTPSYLNVMDKADEYQDISGLDGLGSEEQNQEEEEEKEDAEPVEGRGGVGGCAIHGGRTMGGHGWLLSITVSERRRLSRCH